MKMRNFEGFFCAVLLLFALSACGQADTPPPAAAPSSAAPSPSAPAWQEQYDLGLQHLADGNYEEAVTAFTAAAEIDPKQPAVFVGRGDACRAQGETAGDEAQAVELYEKALADYKQAQTLGAADVQEKHDAVQEQLAAAQEALDAAQAALAREKYYEESLPRLKALYDCLAAGDLEGAKTLMRRGDYRVMSAVAAEGYSGFGGEAGKAYGRFQDISTLADAGQGSPLAYDGGGENWLAVYPNDFYYFGQWADGQRSGHGLWMCAVGDESRDGGRVESYIFEGSWQNNMPNGKGIEIYTAYPEKVTDDNEPIREETQGEYQNGLHHGTILISPYWKDGRVSAYSPITSVNGVYQPMPGGKTYDNGWYVVAKEEKYSLQGHADYHFGVWGWDYCDDN